MEMYTRYIDKCPKRSANININIYICVYMKMFTENIAFLYERYVSVSKYIYI